MVAPPTVEQCKSFVAITACSSLQNVTTAVPLNTGGPALGGKVVARVIATRKMGPAGRNRSKIAPAVISRGRDLTMRGVAVGRGSERGEGLMARLSSPPDGRRMPLAVAYARSAADKHRR